MCLCVVRRFIWYHFVSLPLECGSCSLFCFALLQSVDATPRSQEGLNPIGPVYNWVISACGGCPSQTMLAAMTRVQWVWHGSFEKECVWDSFWVSIKWGYELIYFLVSKEIDWTTPLRPRLTWSGDEPWFGRASCTRRWLVHRVVCSPTVERKEK